MPENKLSWPDFTKVDMRVGTIIEAKVFAEAHQPAYRMKIDFGDLGIKKSSAQITKLYAVEMLIGQQVIAVVNFPPKQIANRQSECLVLGVLGDDQTVTLLIPERSVKNGTRIG